MKHKIQYTKFEFKRPIILSESEYNTLKTLLSQNSKYKLNLKSNFIVAFKFYLYFLGVAAIGILITFLDIAEWLNFIAAIPLFIAFYLFLFSFLPSIVSYFEFLEDKSYYYSKLKKVIINSRDYSDYLLKCRF